MRSASLFARIPPGQECPGDPMTLTITDAYDLPRPEDIRAMGFVIKLREDGE
jgi:hypothetical protein